MRCIFLKNKKYLYYICICLIAILLSSCSESDKKDGKKENPNQTHYDLIVIGGEPEGISAAVSAARNNVDTLLIEDDNALGGLMTLGRLNFLDMNYGPDDELLTRGIFQEFYDEMGNAFDVEEAKKYFLDLVNKEKSITLKLNTSFVKTLMDGNKIVGVLVNEKGEEKKYFAKRVIDASVDADVAAKAGAPYTIGAEDYGEKDRQMGVTLVFNIKGLNWPIIFLYNNYNRVISKVNNKWGDSGGGATWNVAWGYGRQALKYEPKDYMMRLRGPNLARQKKGEVLVNALLIFGVNGLDSDSKIQGIERGKKELPHILEFMKKEFPGFSNVELVDVAEQLYVRETRHIQGEYRLTITDVLENRDHWDRIAHGSYPVDIQPSGPKDLGNVIGKPEIYSIPFRCLVPQKVDGLLVVGRSASYDSLAHGSARVIPVGMATGEAAGVAAAYSIENNAGFREISKDREAIKKIQARIKEQGSYLVEYDPPRPKVMEHWSYPGVKVMRELGLAAGGYKNDYRLDEGSMFWTANHLTQKVLERAYFRNESVVMRKIEYPQYLNKEDLLIGVAEAMTGEKKSSNDVKEYLIQEKVLTDDLLRHMKDLKAQPLFGELYVLMANLYQNLLNS